ncbi:methionine--tRNA ligase, partial [bacterium]|nr:methionine--tRNA ligase [bacterium]
MESERYLVTVALPYANGPLHVGHMVEMIEADIWVRAQRQLGHQCLFVSGNDAHGTPIMLKAEQEGVTPAELVTRIKTEHQAAINAFDISFNNFSRTDTPTNQEYCYQIYEALKADHALFEQESLQAFDEIKQMFLPDRFVKGTCPRCQATDQYGDNCDRCGATYTPAELKEPYSVLTNSPPSFKMSKHLFLNLERYRHWLESYLPKILQESVLAKLKEWFTTELKPWNITREQPYHGFIVPDRPHQCFYVWFDAPIGYLASFSEVINQRNSTDNPLDKHSSWKMIHFIGKDISYFHSLFWPVLLKASEQKLPSKIYVHGFLTVNGHKMSKSKGTFIQANHLAQSIDPELFRYYLASKLTGSIDDINFDLKEFVEKINSDLVGKFVNILSRCSKLLFEHKNGHFKTDALSYPKFEEALALHSFLLKTYT